MLPLPRWCSADAAGKGTIGLDLTGMKEGLCNCPQNSPALGTARPYLSSGLCLQMEMKPEDFQGMVFQTSK